MLAGCCCMWYLFIVAPNYSVNEPRYLSLCNSFGPYSSALEEPVSSFAMSHLLLKLDQQEKRNQAIGPRLPFVLVTDREDKGSRKEFFIPPPCVKQSNMPIHPLNHALLVDGGHISSYDCWFITLFAVHSFYKSFSHCLKDIAIWCNNFKPYDATTLFADLYGRIQVRWCCGYIWPHWKYISRARNTRRNKSHCSFAEICQKPIFLVILTWFTRQSIWVTAKIW